jgi:hypothetical protein
MSAALIVTAALVIGFLWGRIWTLRSLNRKWRRLPLKQRREFVTWNIRNSAAEGRPVDLGPAPQKRSQR